MVVPAQTEALRGAHVGGGSGWRRGRGTLLLTTKLVAAGHFLLVIIFVALNINFILVEVENNPETQSTEKCQPLRNVLNTSYKQTFLLLENNIKSCFFICKNIYI